MYTIRTLITLTAALVCSAASAQDFVPRTDLQPCFEMEERLSRLACYDQVLKRPDVTDTQANTVPEPPEDTIEPAIIEAAKLLNSPYITEDGVFVTLRDRETGGTLSALGEEGLLNSPKPPKITEKFETLRLETDLFLVLPSEQEIGEQAVLVVSCQNNITHLQVYWYERFEGRSEDVRFYYDTSLSDGDSNEDRRFRVRGNGFIIENARGLDSIRLVQEMSKTQRIQVSVGVGADVRSAFFNTEALPSALPMTARHCSWSQS